MSGAGDDGGEGGDGEGDRSRSDDGEEITVVRRDPETAVETALPNTSTGWTVTPLLWAREADPL